jgi:hypothetical protein
MAASGASGACALTLLCDKTNRLGENAVDRPVTFQEVWATLYQNMGLNLSQAREFDLRGRPQYPVDEGVELLREVV